MQHVWQYYVKTISEKGPILRTIISESGRKSKVTLKIMKDLETQQEIPKHDILEFYIRQLR